MYAFVRSILFLTISSLVSGELSILSDIAADNAYTDVHSVYVDGYYVMLYVGNQTRVNNELRDGFFTYTVGLYELVNGELANPSTHGSFNIVSNNTNLRLTVRGNGGPLEPGTLANVNVCSAIECASYVLGQDDKGITTLTYGEVVNPCTDGGRLSVLDKLYSVKEELDYELSVVSRGAEIFAFLCMPNGQLRSLNLQCDGVLGENTVIHGISATITRGHVNVFALLSSGQETTLCSFSEVISELRDILTVVKEASKLRFNYQPTALAVSTASEDHIAFVSSADGKVTKVYIQNKAYPINEFIIVPAITDVFSGMLLDSDRLLVTTTSRMMLLDVKQTCGQYVDLCSCRAPKDPKCGWCVSSDTCTSEATCNGNGDIWIKADPSSDDICWNATINPTSVSRHDLEAIEITLNGNESFGSSAGAYHCLYGSTELQTGALQVTAHSIKCAAPDETAISELPAGTLDIPLVVYYLTRLTYFPLLVHYKMVVCSDISDCGECVSSHDSCTWCINDNRCTTTSTVSSDCRNSSDENARSKFGDTNSCPAIDLEAVTAPVSEAYALTLPMRNLPTMQNQQYFCRVVKEGGGTADISAKRNGNGNTITCSPYMYGVSVASDSFYVNTFTVAVLFGDSKWELGTAAGQAYDCSHRSVCTQCVQAIADTNCVWCSNPNRCRYGQCSTENFGTDTCRSLAVDSNRVEPTDLPVEGGIRLTIPGEGLIVGTGYSVANVDIGDQSCTDIYPQPNVAPQDGDELKCTAPSVKGRQLTDLHVVIDGIAWHSNSSFINYYDPDLERLSVYSNSDHKYGPVAGGTDIKISGKDLSELTSTRWHIEFIDTMKPSHTPLQLVDCTIERENAWIRCKTPPAAATGHYRARLKFTEKSYERNMTSSDEMFEYKVNSTITGINPNKTIQWGGKEFTVSGTHLDSVSGPLLRVSGSAPRDACTMNSPVHMKCTYPKFEATGVIPLTVVMDGINTSLTTVYVTVSENPHFVQFNPEEKPKTDGLILDGSNIDNVELEDIYVFVGGQLCNISKKESGTVICIPPSLTDKQQRENRDVTIEIYGTERFNLGTLNYDEPTKDGLGDDVIGGIAGGAAAAGIIMIVVAVLLFKRSRYHKQRYKSMVKHVDQLECNSRHEIKQAFAELQTDMSDLTSDLNVTGIPYWDYKNFTFKILFPGQTDHPSLHKLMTKRKVAVMQALDMFEHLIQNKDFLMSFIHTLEEQPTFSMPDKVQLAALLMLTLQHKMDYTTTVIKELLSDLIKSSMRDRHPKLLLRRSESVVEKMLTHWLSLCLYKYLQDHAGTPLFMLYKAIKHQIEKGPVDALTGEARYSLSQERLLRLTVDTNPITLDVVLENGERIQCKVNDIDTTTQVKEKILDVLYKNQAYSQRPCAMDYNLEWHHGIAGVPICDEDLTSQTVNGWKRLNTLAHYSIPDNATMKLVSRHRPNSLQSDRSLDTDKLCDTLSSNRGLGTPRGTLNRNGAHSTSNLQDHYIHSHISLWHLSKSSGSHTLPKDRQQTMMSEIFLTRLLKTKGTLQEFIDALFQTIFSADNLPPTIKFLFDFLDQEALKHGVTDPEVVHVWKNNSLNLRFWVNIIKNPEFVFDIHKSEVVDASLSTIAQTFIDSCAMTESDFGVDAPINKLLFAKDRPRYRKMLQNMYSEIRNKAPVAEQALNAHLNELSKMYPREVYRNSALKEIYHFAQRYHSQIIQDLEENFPKHRNPNLTSLLQDIHATLDERPSHLNDYV